MCPAQKFHWGKLLSFPRCYTERVADLVIGSTVHYSFPAAPLGEGSVTVRHQSVCVSRVLGRNWFLPSSPEVFPPCQEGETCENTLLRSCGRSPLSSVDTFSLCMFSIKDGVVSFWRVVPQILSNVLLEGNLRPNTNDFFFLSMHFAVSTQKQKK